MIYTIVIPALIAAWGMSKGQAGLIATSALMPETAASNLLFATKATENFHRKDAKGREGNTGAKKFWNQFWAGDSS